MANFSTPFASTGPRRNPTADERANGFECGAADLLLFNGLFHRLESEVGAVIANAGIVQSDNSFNQLLLAIQALINAATGGGETEDYLLIDQARTRLPIYPEWQTADGTINITSPAPGTVRIPAAVTFLHRGIFPIVTAQTDFATAASKTYHLRWSLAGGYQLRDLVDAGYNPTAAAESNSGFDSSYDDMLIARIVTNAGNVATITNLVNKSRLQFKGFQQPVATVVSSAGVGANTNAATAQGVFNLNWARTPLAMLTGNVGQGSDSTKYVSAYAGYNDAPSVVTRYTISQYATTVWNSSVLGLDVYANFHAIAMA